MAKCRHNGWNRHNCGHSEDVGVHCSNHHHTSTPTLTPTRSRYTPTLPPGAMTCFYTCQRAYASIGTNASEDAQCSAINTFATCLRSQPSSCHSSYTSYVKQASLKFLLFEKKAMHCNTTRPGHSTGSPSSMWATSTPTYTPTVARPRPTGRCQTKLYAESKESEASKCYSAKVGQNYSDISRMRAASCECMGKSSAFCSSDCSIFKAQSQHYYRCPINCARAKCDSAVVAKCESDLGRQLRSEMIAARIDTAGLCGILRLYSECLKPSCASQLFVAAKIFTKRNCSALLSGSAMAGRGTGLLAVQ